MLQQNCCPGQHFAPFKDNNELIDLLLGEYFLDVTHQHTQGMFEG